MTVTISGTDGITTPGLTNTGTETLVNLTTTGNTTLGDASTDTLNVGNGGLIKDASGNLGLGVTPNAWGGALSAGMDFKFSGGIASHNSANAFYLVANGYYNSSGVWKYRQNGYANYVNVGNGDGSIAFYNAASGTAGNSISFTQAMTLDASGNLGIGTSSPYSAITLGKAGGGQYISAVDNTTGYQIGYLQFNSDNITLNAQGGAGGTSNFIRILTGGSEKARIDSSGNLLVGTTTASYTSSGRGNITLGGSSSALYALQVNGTPKGYLYQDGTDMYLVSATGRITITAQSSGVYLANGATSWTSNSDERKKDIIEPILNAATKVSTLRAVIGKYKTDNDGRRRSFLIAQDVQAVFPEAVEASNPDDLGVQYTEVIPLLVAAIQEQQVLITTLTDRITALENK